MRIHLLTATGTRCGRRGEPKGSSGDLTLLTNKSHTIWATQERERVTCDRCLNPINKEKQS
jgi:hypothetical protein